MARRGGADGFDVSVLGDRALQKKLDRLGKAAGGKMLQSAMREAMKPVLAAARAAAPRDTGTLARKIKLSSVRLRGKGKGVAVRTPTRAQLGIPKDAKGYYPAHVEFGTRKMPARPYMRPALETNRSRALELLRTGLWARLEPEVSR